MLFPNVNQSSVSPLGVVSYCSNSCCAIDFICFICDKRFRDVENEVLGVVVVWEGDDFVECISFFFQIVFTQFF